MPTRNPYAGPTAAGVLRSMQGSTIESMSASTPPNDATPRTLAAAGLPRRVRKALEQALSLVSIEPDIRLSKMRKEFEQVLFRLADLARTPGFESNYMQTLRTLRMNRADLIPRFMLEHEAGVAVIRTAQHAPEESDAGARVRFQNLSLVEDEVMDEGAVLRGVAIRQESRAALPLHLLGQRFGEIGRVSCRERVCQYVQISVVTAPFQTQPYISIRNTN